jgi:predicted Fe-S protein YdhL (DUF1289 family)
VNPGDPASPCTAVCILDPASGLCRGCFRTIDEITRWAVMGAEEKRRILAELPDRRGPPQQLPMDKS